MSDRNYPGFEAVFRACIDDGKSRTEAIRAACRAWLEHVCRERSISVDRRQRDKLVTEGLKIYDEYRFDNRSHERAHTAAQNHIQDALSGGGSRGGRSGGRSGGGGLDDMSDMFDSLPPRSSVSHSSRPHHGSSSSRPHHGGSTSSSHYGGGSSYRPHHGGSSSSRPHHGSSSSSRPHHSGGRSGTDQGNGFFPDGAPRPHWAKPSNMQNDIDSDEEDRLFGPDDGKHGRKPPKQSGGGRGYNTQEFRPSGSSGFGTDPHSSSQSSRYPGGAGGSSGRGYNTQEFRPSPGGFNPSDFMGGGGGSRAGRSGGGSDPFSMFDQFMNGSGMGGGMGGGGMGGNGGSGGPRGYNTQEFRPSPGFDFGSSFGGGGGSGSSRRRPPPANYDSDDDSMPPPPRPDHGYGHSSSSRHHRPHRSNSADSHHDLSDDESSAHYRSSSRRQNTYPPGFDLGARPPTCFYKVLDIPKSASDSEIKKAYRKMSLKYHPDRAVASGIDKARATRKMAEINQANDVLTDPSKRRHYDATGCIKPS